jgi:DNA invertase Pin-like site-specific DNA recombinase
VTVFGYARVSTNGQTLVSQDAQLRAAGCAKVYAEKVSGARSDRAELAKLLKRLEPGDTVIVTRLDRLARSTRDLLNMLDAVAKAGAIDAQLGPTARSRMDIAIIAVRAWRR